MASPFAALVVEGLHRATMFTRAVRAPERSSHLPRRYQGSCRAGTAGEAGSVDEQRPYGDEVQEVAPTPAPPQTGGDIYIYIYGFHVLRTCTHVLRMYMYIHKYP